MAWAFRKVFNFPTAGLAQKVSKHFQRLFVDSQSTFTFILSILPSFDHRSFHLTSLPSSFAFDLLQVSLQFSFIFHRASTRITSRNSSSVIVFPLFLLGLFFGSSAFFDSRKAIRTETWHSNPLYVTLGQPLTDATSLKQKNACTLNKIYVPSRNEKWSRNFLARV